jgi:hypothetical protein
MVRAKNERSKETIMNMNLELTLRSLFRHTWMIEQSYPGIVLELEEEILRNRMMSLTEDELEYINLNFDKLYNEYLIESEINDIMFSEQLNSKMKSLN